jgi:hypothetical protein
MRDPPVELKPEPRRWAKSSERFVTAAGDARQARSAGLGDAAELRRLAQRVVSPVFWISQVVATRVDLDEFFMPRCRILMRSTCGGS